jgi:hypothetical protein
LMKTEECLILTCMWYFCQGVKFSPPTIDSQDIQKSIPPQAQPPRSTPQGTPNARMTRSGSTSQNKGGNSNVAFTTTKQLKENVARKRSAANNRKNAQVLSSCSSVVSMLAFNAKSKDTQKLLRWKFKTMLAILVYFR